jgi:hypothetical protein
MIILAYSDKTLHFKFNLKKKKNFKKFEKNEIFFNATLVFFYLFKKNFFFFFFFIFFESDMEIKKKLLKKCQSSS